MQINIGELHIHAATKCRELEYAFTLDNQTVFFKRSLRMLLTLPPRHRVRFTLPTAGTDEHGNPVPLETIPEVSVSDDTMLEVVQPHPDTPDDPASGYLRSFGKSGSAQFVITEDEADEPLTILVDVAIPTGRLVTLPDPIFGEVEPDPDDDVTPDPTPDPTP